MLLKLSYAFAIICIVSVLGYLFFIYSFGRGFAGADRLKDPQCETHKAKRISFNIDKRKLDLSRMIDSFQTLHPQYIQADSAVQDSADTSVRNCCCIVDNKTIFFPGNPTETYNIDIERFRFHAGFEGEYYDDIGYIDVVSTYANGKWQYRLTSKLDSAEKKRILNRFRSEVLSKLPTIADTSSHEDEKWLNQSN